jgi:hypothetical protein
LELSAALIERRASLLMGDTGGRWASAPPPALVILGRTEDRAPNPEMTERATPPRREILLFDQAHWTVSAIQAAAWGKGRFPAFDAHRRSACAAFALGGDPGSLLGGG